MTDIQQPKPQDLIQSPSSKTITLSIKHPTLINQNHPINAKESLAELKQYLSQTSPLYLYQNFHFQSNGKLIPQYVEIDTVFEGETGDIDVVLDLFDERTSKYHVKKINQLIKNPAMWTVLSSKDIEPKIKEDVIPVKDKELNIEFVMKPNLNSPYYQLKEEKETKESIVFLNFSGYNPAPSYRKLTGDFYYLHIRTLETIDYHITANAKGFYINNSNMNYFDPEPHPLHKGVYSNILNLIKNISPKFKKLFQDETNDNTMNEVERISLMSGYKNTNYWLVDKKQTQHTWSGNSVEIQLLDTGTGIKDWNEMFQAQAALPSQTHLEKLNKSKLFIKLYTDFIAAATEGAKNLVDGKMAPLNPLDPKQQHIYIHNSIFYSIAQETPYDYSQQKGLEATPTVTAINADLRNLQKILNLEIQGLHVLHMVLVEYRGSRVICQCIIPGILSADQLNCSQYGSIDDGKTIQNNKQFEYLMIKVCDKLDLDSNVEFVDEKGEKKRIAGNLDIKGILGNDKRKYLLDLMRLSPRDYNYLGTQNDSCVLRSELVDIYREFLNQSKQSNQYSILLPKKLECPMNTNLETGVDFIRNDLTQKQQAQLKSMALFLRQRCIPKFIESLQTVQRKNLGDSKSITAILHKFGINSRYLGQIINHPMLKNEPHIRVILERIVLVKSLKHLFRMAMRDSSTLYLSGVLSRLLNCIFGNQIQRSKLENEGEEVVEEKKEKVSNDKEKQKEKEKTDQKGRKKNKNKNNKNKSQPIQQKVQIDIGDGGISPNSCKYISIKPSQAWNLVKKLALARYSYQLPQTISQLTIFNNLPFNKLATLRDLCLSIGLLIERKSYPFSEKDQQIPFQPRNIIELQPLSKHIPLVSNQIVKIINTGDALLGSMKIQQAIQMYNSAVQYLIGLYGGLHEDIASLHHKIATIYYKLGDYDAAVACQRNSLELLKLMYGQDHIKTIEAITNLGLFYFSKGDTERALFYLFKSLFLSNLSFGQCYPDTIVNYMNLSAIYQQVKQYQQTILCLLQCLDRVEIIYGKDNINIAACYTALATIHYEINDIRQCVDYQQKSVQSLKNSLKQNDQRLIDAQNLLNYYKDTFNTKKIEQPVEKKSNKKEQQKYQQQIADQQAYMMAMAGAKNDNSERAMLLRKLQQAKWNNRIGHR